MDAGMDDAEREVRETLARRATTMLHGTVDAGEQDMMLSLLRGHDDPEFRFAAACEWEYEPGRADLGRGDLVFAAHRHVQYGKDHAPCPVLVVELKFLTDRSGATARVSRTKKRNKVRDQAYSSGSAWLLRHPNDQVYIATYTNEDCTLSKRTFLGTAGKLARATGAGDKDEDVEEADQNDEAEYRGEDGKLSAVLEPNLVPREAWGKMYRPSMDSELVDVLQQSERDRAGHCCEHCGVAEGAATPLNLHQEWRVDTDTDELTFLRFEVVCFACHDVKHAGWAKAEKRGGEPLFQHMGTVMERKARENAAVRTELAETKAMLAMTSEKGDGDEASEEHAAFIAAGLRCNNAFKRWHESSGQCEWKIISTNLYRHAAVRAWLRRSGRSVGRFGSLCLLREGGLNACHPASRS
jgi:hypothetical protein